MKAYVEKTGKTIDMRFNGTIKDFFAKAKINPETVIAVRNNALLTEDSILSDKDEIKLLSVVSGG